MIPISLAIFALDILSTVCFAKALRTTLAVIIVLMIYFPRYSSGRGAVLGMLFAVVTTTVWYRSVITVTPLIVMLINHIIGKNDCVLQNDTSSKSNKEGKVINLVALGT
ncbi:hypothetical protein ACIROD_16775 [Peribacillus sp. NPDC101481]|uniref:hypothetical protein n=1 Tax=Peribacillus sp. NPDC101481 TaxID=3364403 RepID=UPI00380F1DEF